MLRTILAVVALGAAVAIFSCTAAKLGGDSKDASTESAPITCPARLTPAYCYDPCDSSFHAVPPSGSCGAGQEYHPAECQGIVSDGWGPVTNGCRTDGGADGGCTDLANDAPPAPVRNHTGARPADAEGAGGVIVDGVYDGISVDNYLLSESYPDSTVVLTIRISNNGMQMESVGTGGRGEVSALAVAGTQVTETKTCWFSGLPPGDPTTEGYTATSDTLMLSNPYSVRQYRRRN